MKNDHMTLEDYLDNVHDRETFFDFIWALYTDRADSIEKEKVKPSSPYEADANGWENVRIDSFFEAALSWVTDTGKVPEEPSWQVFARFLYAGKIYE